VLVVVLVLLVVAVMVLASSFAAGGAAVAEALVLMLLLLSLDFSAWEEGEGALLLLLCWGEEGDRPQTYAWEMKERRRSKRSSTSEDKDNGSVVATAAFTRVSISCRSVALPQSKSLGKSSPRASSTSNKGGGEVGATV
jgi:hypothetical protein